MVFKLSEDVIHSTIEKYEAEIADSDIEHAVVIMRTGFVCKCHGVKGNVYPDVDLGADLLQGAWVMYNHPIEKTEFTFSKDDLNLFLNYQLSILRGIDEKYIYEFTRDAMQIDE